MVADHHAVLMAVFLLLHHREFVVVNDAKTEALLPLYVLEQVMLASLRAVVLLLRLWLMLVTLLLCI